jgi:hypothetical protein
MPVRMLSAPGLERLHDRGGGQVEKRESRDAEEHAPPVGLLARPDECAPRRCDGHGADRESRGTEVRDAVDQRIRRCLQREHVSCTKRNERECAEPCRSVAGASPELAQGDRLPGPGEHERRAVENERRHVRDRGDRDCVENQPGVVVLLPRSPGTSEGTEGNREHRRGASGEVSTSTRERVRRSVEEDCMRDGQRKLPRECKLDDRGAAREALRKSREQDGTCGPADRERRSVDQKSKSSIGGRKRDAEQECCYFPAISPESQQAGPKSEVGQAHSRHPEAGSMGASVTEADSSAPDSCHKKRIQRHEQRGRRAQGGRWYPELEPERGHEAQSAEDAEHNNDRQVGG